MHWKMFSDDVLGGVLFEIEFFVEQMKDYGLDVDLFELLKLTLIIDAKSFRKLFYMIVNLQFQLIRYKIQQLLITRNQKYRRIFGAALSILEAIQYLDVEKASFLGKIGILDVHELAVYQVVLKIDVVLGSDDGILVI